MRIRSSVLSSVLLLHLTRQMLWMPRTGNTVIIIDRVSTIVILTPSAQTSRLPTFQESLLATAASTAPAQLQNRILT